MSASTKNQRAAGKTAAKRGAAAKEPKTYPDTPEGKMEAAMDGLRSSLKAYEEGVAYIADCDVSKAKIEKEIHDYLETIDPRDEKGVGLVSAKRDMVGLMPRYKEREEKRQDERGDALGRELVAVVPIILACAAAETGARRVIIEDAIRPFFPPYKLPADRLQGLPERDFDPVPQIAAGSVLVSDGFPVELTLPLSWRRPEGERSYRNEQEIRTYDRELIDRARCLLGIHQAWLDNDRRFLRRPLPRLGFQHEPGTWDGGKPETAQGAAQPVSAVPRADNAGKRLLGVGEERRRPIFRASMSQGQLSAREARAAVSRRVREALSARGWTVDGLARMAGRRKSSVVNVIAGGNASPDSRLRVELAVGAPFWTAPGVFAACLAVAAFYGGKHPRTLNLRQLDALAAKHLRPAGIRGRIRPRAALIAKLEALAAAR